MMASLYQYLLSTVGGKTIMRSQDLGRLADEARAVFEEGWPVFIKSSIGSENIVEFKRVGHVTQVIPGIYANRAWVERVVEVMGL